MGGGAGVVPPKWSFPSATPVPLISWGSTCCWLARQNCSQGCLQEMEAIPGGSWLLPIPITCHLLRCERRSWVPILFKGAEGDSVGRMRAARASPVLSWGLVLRGVFVYGPVLCAPKGSSEQLQGPSMPMVKSIQSAYGTGKLQQVSWVSNKVPHHDSATLWLCWGCACLHIFVI